MNPERKEILNLISLPGRMNAAEAAWRLGFEPDHIPILVSAGQLKPLGNPPPGSVKFFLTVEIEQKKVDARWLNKATEIVRLKIKDKNERIRALFHATLARDPTESEWGRLSPLVSHGAARDGFGDLLWALLNSAEFKLER